MCILFFPHFTAAKLEMQLYRKIAVFPFSDWLLIQEMKSGLYVRDTAMRKAWFALSIMCKKMHLSLHTQRESIFMTYHYVISNCLFSTFLCILGCNHWLWNHCLHMGKPVEFFLCCISLAVSLTHGTVSLELWVNSLAIGLTHSPAPGIVANFNQPITRQNIFRKNADTA